MLRELSVRDILLIDTLELEFQPGLNVLTGETGAGKSILLDCLGVVLGWRGRADVVRAGAAQGEVTAVFELPGDHPARAVVEEASLPWDDALILRRITSPDGRKRGFVNDRRASGEVLRALSATLVELHGQQDDRGLLDPRAHYALLDSFGGLEDDRSATREAWRALAAARKARGAAEETLREAARDTEYLRHAVAELTELAPEPGEDAALDTRRRTMQMADKIREDVARAVEVMGPEGAEGRLAEAIRWLEVVADRTGGALDAPIAALGRAMIELDDARDRTTAFQGGLDFDAYELEAVEERLFALRGLARKHNCQVDELPQLAEDLAARLAAIDGGDAEVERLRGLERAAQTAFDAAAGRLSAARRTAAGALDAAMAEELAPLKHRGGRSRARARGGGCGDVHRGHEPRRARRTFGQDRLRRGVVAVSVGVEGLSGRALRGADDDLR